MWQAETAFDEAERKRGNVVHRTCSECTQKRNCKACGLLLPRSAFSSLANWKNPDQRKCDACLQKKRGYWTRMQCKTSWAKSEFSMWLQQKGRTTNDGRAQCNTCFAEAEQERRKMAQASAAMVIKR